MLQAKTPSPRERRGKWGKEYLRPTTPHIVKRGKGVKVFSWFLCLLVWRDWGLEILRPSIPPVVKRGVPLSKGEGRVRVQHGWCKKPSCQTSSFKTILELPLRGVPIASKSTCSYDQCTPRGKCINFVLKLQTSKMLKNKWLKKGGYKKC